MASTQPKQQQQQSSKTIVKRGRGRGGRGGQGGQGGEKKDFRDETDCPICFQPFGVRRRTKVYAFGCNGGGLGHATCSECNARLFMRQMDCCPLCRAPRVDYKSTGSAGSTGSTGSAGGSVFPVSESVFQPVAHDTLINRLQSESVFQVALESLLRPDLVPLQTFLGRLCELKRVGRSDEPGN